MRKVLFLALDWRSMSKPTKSTLEQNVAFAALERGPWKHEQGSICCGFISSAPFLKSQSLRRHERSQEATQRVQANKRDNLAITPKSGLTCAHETYTSRKHD